MDLELRGKKVLITGASKGLGLACAQGFASEGAIVHLAARNEAALKSANQRHDLLVLQHPLPVLVEFFPGAGLRRLAQLRALRARHH